jgi:hypothetical protein
MILTPAPLQKPALQPGAARTLRPMLPPTRPVLQTPHRAPQQLSLDLQPRSR